MKDASMKK